MKNKNSEVDPLKVVISATLLLLLSWIVSKYIIFDIFVNEQVAFAGEKTEEVTKDCDEDDVIGLMDKCPCVKGKYKKEDLPCENPDAKATTNCPILCKK